MMSHQWCSKQSVIKDLAQLSVGGRVQEDSLTTVVHKPRQLDFDPECSESLLLFRNGVHQSSEDDVPVDETIDPSQFQYINEMLNMVKYEEEPETCVSNINSDYISTDILEISKLNPNVKEFKSIRLSETKGIPNCGVTKDIIENNKCEKHDNGISKECAMKSKDIVNDKINVDDIEYRKNVLREKINSNAQSSCLYKRKLEKNVAIANLMKLHSSSPTKEITKRDLHKDNTDEQQQQKTVKLMTPNDFITSQANNPDVNNDNIPTDECKPLDQPTNSEVQISINKVNDWLSNDKTLTCENKKHKEVKADENSKTTGPSIALRPITFKRKSNTVINSPETIQSTPSNRSLSPHTPKQFKPSKLSQDFYQDYLKKQEIKEKLQEDIWTRVERLLKEKEKLLLEKK